MPSGPRRSCLLVASLLAFATSAGWGATWYVDDDAPADPAPGDPTVSVLTTCYNRADFLEETIESVLASRFTDYEYIIVEPVTTYRGPESKFKHISDADIERASSYFRVALQRELNRVYSVTGSSGPRTMPPALHPWRY